MNVLPLELNLYSDYLVVNQGQASATRLAALLEGEFSHDAFTRKLTQVDYGSRHLWQVVKPFVGQMAQADGVMILDDTVEEKAYMRLNELINYHYDHAKGRCVRGINQPRGFPWFMQVDLYLEDIWLNGRDSLDMAKVRRQVRGALDQCPQASVVIRLHVNAPFWWNEAHPDECTEYADGPIQTDLQAGAPYHNEQFDIDRPLYFVRKELFGR